MTAALQFENVVKHYGKTCALAGLTLRVPRGSIFGLVGSNGAGKTTLLSIAAGQVRPQAGTTNVLGRGAFSPATHAGRVTLLPQDAGLPYYARADHLLTYYARLQGMGRGEAERSVRDVLAWVHLADRAKNRVRSLSHGMKRRVTIAQAFLGNPDLVLLDEPMSGLDPAEVKNIRRLIRERKERQTILISSHMLYELQHLCDHVAIIERGKLVRQDTMQAMIRHSHRLVYHLGTTPPIERLREALPGVVFEWNVQVEELAAVYHDTDLDPAVLNARVLPLLLEAGCAITEVTRGSDLESEYFKSRSETA